MEIKIIFTIILLFSMGLPIGGYLLGKKKRRSVRRLLTVNVLLFFGTLVVADILLFSGQIYGAETKMLQTAAADSAAAGTYSAASEGFKYIAAALSTGLSCIGAGVAVASAASAAIGALSEDPAIMGKALIFVALAESIALYGLLISFSILG